MDASDHGKTNGTRRIVTHRDLETMDVDLDALRKVLRAERMTSADVLHAKDASQTAVVLRTQKRRAA